MRSCGCTGPVHYVVHRTRELIGRTRPCEAAACTIRRRFGTSAEANAIHSSDSSAAAYRELSVVLALQ
ncbi:Nucleoside diphosphate kinase [Candidatus Tremblaya princeps]|uniref:Nucleoside diphosphate kinase n=1 Tax=Tremblaya princeps TaxID=189385 RepID=A0A143WPG4_TREPR|nr:Nucleoside diphosphate kinase [Candidatus Tremblaya princeps]